MNIQWNRRILYLLYQNVAFHRNKRQSSQTYFSDSESISLFDLLCVIDVWSRQLVTWSLWLIPPFEKCHQSWWYYLIVSPRLKVYHILRKITNDDITNETVPDYSFIASYLLKGSVYIRHLSLSPAVIMRDETITSLMRSS